MQGMGQMGGNRMMGQGGIPQMGGGRMMGPMGIQGGPGQFGMGGRMPSQMLPRSGTKMIILKGFSLFFPLLFSAMEHENIKQWYRIVRTTTVKAEINKTIFTFFYSNVCFDQEL